MVEDPVIPNTVHMRSISLYQAAVLRLGMGLGSRNRCQKVLLAVDEAAPGSSGLPPGEEKERCLVLVVAVCPRRRDESTSACVMKDRTEGSSSRLLRIIVAAILACSR